jgi:multidrug resistance efflux pump
MKHWNCLWCLLLVVVTGCQSVLGDVETPPPTIPPVRAERGTVRVEGRVEPERAVTMQIGEARQVASVSVAAGDRVTMDETLLSFDSTAAVLAIEQAEAALAMAGAQVARLRSGPQPEYVALLDAQVAAATAVVSQSAASVAAEAAGDQADIEVAQAQILEAQIAHDKAWEAHEDTMTCYDIERPDGTHREICPTLGTFEEMARAEMHATYARLEAAQANLETVKSLGWAEVNAAKISEAVAAARLEMTHAEREKALAGARAEEIAIAEAAVDAAATALARAQKQLEATVLTAPFDAVVTEVKVDPHDTIAPGTSVVTLASLDALRVRTQNLTELDVVEVEEGQTVALRADANPGVVFNGRVERIEPQGAEHLGDVTYSVLIVPESELDWLRWGMTVEVEIGVDAAPDLAVDSRTAISGTGPRIADATIEPVWDTQIGSDRVGDVAEINVRPGDTVTAGDILVRLEDDQAKLAVAEAEANLRTADAQLAQIKTGPRAEEIDDVGAELNVAEAEVGQARARYHLVVAQVGDAQSESVQAELEAAQARRRTIQAHLQWAEDDDHEERVKTLKDQLVAVNQQIFAFETRLDALPRATSAQLQAAEAGIRMAEAQRDAAAARLAWLKKGPIEAEIDVAEARVRQAEAALAAARLRLRRSTVAAPSDGTVTQVHVEVGDKVAPGQPIIVIAPLDRLQVRTQNLLEVDVVGIAPDQPVAIKVDALPDRVLRGRVVRIGPQHEIYRGDVTYPVWIALEEEAPQLRWGMSAVVEIDAL